MGKILKGKCLFAQSGGPTAVINASIWGAINCALKYEEIEGIYGAINGILGVLLENIIDLKKEKRKTLEGLMHTPSSALGSCRYKLKEEDYEKVLKVLTAHNIRYFFVAGGNDSMDTANCVSKLAKQKNYELRVMGIPKTVDNDLVITDHCPGYGSVARWLAIAVRDACKDTEAIYTADPIKIVETMGRNSGWIAASTSLAKSPSVVGQGRKVAKEGPPHLILLPEVPFNQDKFLSRVEEIYKEQKYVVITVCEGIRDEKGEYLTVSQREIDTDGFGHKQLGGVGEYLVELIAKNLKIKARCDKPGTIQRVSIICASKVDLEEAYLVGETAVRRAIEGISDCMVTLVREDYEKYICTTGLAKLEEVANKEKKVPPEFIDEERFGVTDKFIKYAKPLIGDPLPEYVQLEKNFVKKKVIKTDLKF